MDYVLPRYFDTRTWTNVHALDQCNSTFMDLKQISYELEYILAYNIKEPASDFNRYRRGVEELYLNTSVNISEILEHVECLDAQDEAMDVVGIYETMAELAVNVTRSDTFAEAYSYAIQIPPLFKVTEVSYAYENLGVIESNVQIKCNWLSKISNKIMVMAYVDHIFQEAENLVELPSNIRLLFKSMAPFFNNLNNEIRHNIKIFTGKAQDYLDQKITKSKLSQKFASTHFLMYKENVEDLTDDLQQVIKDYKKEITTGMDKLKDYYKTYLKLDLPVINYNNVYQLNLVKNAAQINDTILQNITNGLENNLEENMAALITETYQRLIQPFTDMETNLLDPVEDMLEQIKDLDESLMEYKLSNKMNTNFFM